MRIDTTLPAPGSPRAAVLAVALAGLLLAGLGFGVAMPWLEHVQAIEARLAAETGRATALSARIAALEAAPEPQAPALDGLLIEAPSMAEAVAAFQTYLQAAARTAGMQVTSIQASAGEEMRGAIQLAARLQLTGRSETLQALLHSLEAGSPLVVTGGLSVHARSGTGAADVDRLDVRLDALAWAVMRGAGQAGDE